MAEETRKAMPSLLHRKSSFGRATTSSIRCSGESASHIKDRHTAESKPRHAKPSGLSLSLFFLIAMMVTSLPIRSSMGEHVAELHSTYFVALVEPLASAPASPGGSYKAVYGLVPFAAFLVTFFKLLYLLVRVTTAGEDRAAKLGRWLIASIPPLLLYWAAEDYSGQVRQGFMANLLVIRSQSFGTRCGLLLTFAVASFLFFYALWKICERFDGHLASSFVVLSLASLVSLFAPIFWTLLAIPEINKYSLVDAGIGSLVGSLAIIAVMLQSGYINLRGPGLLERLVSATERALNSRGKMN